MKKQENCLDVGLPQEIYAGQLETINGINFTRREVDVITCIVSGKTAKHIAAFLFISPKTVENHIRNIMLKTGCRSQAAIIDFLEKSDRFLSIKDHYSCLLIQYAFASELKKISKRLPKKLNFFIVFNKPIKNTAQFFNYFINDLQVAGIKVVTEQRKEDERSFYWLDNIRHSTIKTILYYVETEQVEQLDFKGIEQFIRQHSYRLIFIIVSNDTAVRMLQECSNFEILVLQESKNYYLFVFEVLKKLLAPLDLQTSILSFKQQYEKFSGLQPTQGKQEQIQSPLWDRKPSFLNILKKQKTLPWAVGTLCFLLMGVAIFLNLTFQHRKEIPNMRTKGLYASVRWNLPRQDNIFINRKQLMETLVNQFNTVPKQENLVFESHEHMPIVSVLSGGGGVGKTQLALRYVYQLKEIYTLEAWFYAENIAQLKQQYIDFSKILGIKEVNPSFESALSYVKTSLSQRSDWLLIFDNVTYYQEIKDFLPEGRGNIIMTTRQRDWPNTFKLLDVNVMTKEEALQLIVSITGRKIDSQTQETVEKLVKRLGYLPLALAQASAYIKNNGIGFKSYLERYDQIEQKMLSDHTMPSGTAHVPVSITWVTDFEAIKREAIQQRLPPLAAILITVCAYLDPNQIPKELLVHWLRKTYPEEKDPDLLLDQLLGQLNRYSLITLNLEKKTIDIHRLVQAVLRHQHREMKKGIDQYHSLLSQSWFENLLNVTHEEFNRKTSLIEEEQRKQSLLPHLQSLVANYNHLNLDPQNYTVALITFDIGCALLCKEPSLSKVYLEQSLKIFEKKHGSNHWFVSRTLRKLGHLAWVLGDIDQSKALLEKALSIDEKIKSNELANTLNNLGNIYGVSGRVKEQCRLLEKALKMGEQSKETNNSSIAIRLNNLGNAYVASGETYKGKQMLERSLAIFEQEFGCDFYKVSSVLTSLGHANWVLGDLEQAKTQLERALKIKESYYHAEHIAIGISLNNLGNVYKDLGDIDQAISCLERALNISRQHYGKSHLATAIILNNLGELHLRVNDMNLAKPFLMQAKEIKQEYGLNETSLNFGTEFGILGDVHHKKIDL